MNLVETLSKKFKDHGNFFVNILFSPFILYKINIAGNLGGVYYELLEDFMCTNTRACNELNARKFNVIPKSRVIVGIGKDRNLGVVFVPFRFHYR